MKVSLSQMSLRACETLKPFALPLSISPVLFPNAPCARSDNCDNRPPCGGRWPRCAGRPAAASSGQARPQAGAGHLGADGAAAGPEGAVVHSSSPLFEPPRVCPDRRNAPARCTFAIGVYANLSSIWG